MKLKGLLVQLVAVMLLGIFAAGTAQGEFYAGKTITLIVPYGAGGGTDVLARQLASHLERHIPGSPKVIVENMPGGGGLIGASNVITTGQNGQKLLLIDSGILFRASLGESGAKVFDFKQLTPILAGPVDIVTYTGPHTGIESGEELAEADNELSVGIMDAFYNYESVVAMELLGVPYKTVPGYTGQSEIQLAVQRGEVDIHGQTSPAYLTKLAPLVQEGELIPLFANGLFDENGNVVRNPADAMADVPTFAEVYENVQGEELSGVKLDAYKMGIARNLVSKLLYIHAEAPEEAKEALRAGAAGVQADEEAAQELGRATGGLPIRVGAELDAAVAPIVDMPEEVRQWLQDWMAQFGAEFN